MSHVPCMVLRVCACMCWAVTPQQLRRSHEAALNAAEKAEDLAFKLKKLKRRQERGHVHIRGEDIDAAQQCAAQAQQALAAARQRKRNDHDVLLSLDAVQYPEARYYADTAAGRAPPQHGLGLLHASGLFVDRQLDTDYEVRGAPTTPFIPRRVRPHRLPTSVPPVGARFCRR